MNEIKVLIKWRIVHGYYSGGICRGIELSPTCQTMELLRRRGVMFRKFAENEWGILGTDETVWNEEDEIVLERKITDGLFLYVTENPEDFQQIAIGAGMMGPEQENILNFEVKALKWEYIFIPREGQVERQIELLETSGLLHFSVMEKVVELGKAAWRTVTEEKVAFRENYDYQFRLIERKVLGNRVLNKNLVFPRPGQFIYAGEGCIRQMVYY